MDQEDGVEQWDFTKIKKSQKKNEYKIQYQKKQIHDLCVFSFLLFCGNPNQH